MKNIEAMICKAIAATGEPVALLVEPVEGQPWGFSVALVSATSGEPGALGETLTLESDWQTHLTGIGPTLAEALELLDQVCAEDFRPTGADLQDGDVCPN